MKTKYEDRHIVEWKNLPIIIMFYCFPILSIMSKIVGIGLFNYDFFWICAFALTLILSFDVKMPWKYIVLMSVIGFLLFLKYGIPFVFERGVQLHPWMMDMKWIVYLFFSLLWMCNYGEPSPHYIYKGSKFFAKVYILWTIYVIASGQLSRDGILMESNYDGFMILMGLCWVDRCKEGKYDLLIFIIATFMTFSRTGIVSLFILLLYKVARRNILYLLPMVPVVTIFACMAFVIRGEESAGNMDRLIFFSQAYAYLTHTSLWNILLGSTPGISLEMPVIKGFEWYIDNFEETKGLSGIYPFYFHSTYLRLLMTWGVFGSLAYLLFFVYKFLNSKIIPMKMFCLLVLVQSVSLSTMTLQNVSILFFMMLFTLMSIENRRCKLFTLLKR